MEYTWMNEQDLVGYNNAWLRSACRERGVSGYSKMNRRALLDALLAWQD